MSAGAQSVYRCGNVYSQSSCQQARVVEVDDMRSEAQRSDAQLLAASDKRLGNELQRELPGARPGREVGCEAASPREAGDACSCDDDQVVQALT